MNGPVLSSSRTTGHLCLLVLLSFLLLHLNLAYIRLRGLYLAREGSHLRRSINDAGLRMTHADTKVAERFPTAAATLGVNLRHRAANMAESRTGRPLLNVSQGPTFEIRLSGAKELGGMCASVCRRVKH